MAFPWTPNIDLNSVFKHNLRVPDYQRDYAWSSDEAADFIEDLIDFTNSNDEDYLFGQFIFYTEKKEDDDKEKQERFIIDGQQRIITTVIFLSAARNIVDNVDNPLNIDRINDENYTKFKTFLLNCIGSEKEGNFKLVIKGNARSYFENNIQRKGGPTSSGKYKATKNIKKVYDVIENRLYDYIKNANSDDEKFNLIYDLTYCLLSNFVVSIILTNDLSQAYTIFETLNSRGKDLEPSDLLKNYFFQKCSNYASSVKDNWTKIDEMMDEANLPVVSLIRSFWNCKFDHVRKNALYRVVSRNLTNELEIKQFTDGLREVCPFYISLNNPENNAFKDLKIQKILKGLKALGAKIYHPLILACIIAKIDNSTIRKLLEVIESLFIRNIVIGPESANSYEELFSSYGQMITSGEKSPEQIIEEIRIKLRSDSAFESDFENAIIKKSDTARYIISKIYNFENGKEIEINSDASEVQLEHIMPKSNDKWKVPEEIHETFLYYLGNQTLLLSSDNTEASNELFNTKKIIYSRSSIKQNEYFSSVDVWSEKEIKHRQKQLFETAKKCW